MGMTIASAERLCSIAADYSTSDKLWMDEKVSLRVQTALTGFSALSDSWNLLGSCWSMKSQQRKVQEFTRAGKLVVLAVSAFVLGILAPTAVFAIQKQLGLQAHEPNVMRRLMGRVGRVVGSFSPIVKVIAATGLLFTAAFVIHRCYHWTPADTLALAPYQAKVYDHLKPLIDPVMKQWNRIDHESQNAIIYAGKVVAEVVVIVPTAVLGLALMRKTAMLGVETIRKMWRSI